MNFKILDRFGRPPYNAKSVGYFIWDNWNDYSFYTLFGFIYVDENSVTHDIGSIKIGYFGQKETDRKLSIGDTFDALDDSFFSLGQSDSYYENLNSFSSEIRNLILTQLNDIARDKNLFKKAIKENVTKISLLRSVSPTTVTGQYNRLASGGVRLTDYSFKFFAPKIRQDSASFELSFNVVPESYPPTNVHVLIGRNGVGKTHLTNNMISTLIDNNKLVNESGVFEFESNDDNDNMFANLISISFSAFDETEPKSEKKDKTKGIQYSYIGLKQVQISKEKPLGTKSTTKLKNEFFKSLDYCKRSSKKKRWKKGIEMLESDPNFKDANIKSLIDIEDETEFKKNAYSIFRRLSSGHKIVLLTITRLIERLQEKSLVLIDEPEAHLHPPLLSAFIRALSELLINSNGVAIIATHSPVILQEVPKSCAWKLRRIGAEAIAERLLTESFGENVGILTNEVFGLEVTNSGFYNLLNKVAQDKMNYDDAVDYFDGQLGMEARAILMTHYANMNK